MNETQFSCNSTHLPFNGPQLNQQISNPGPLLLPELSNACTTVSPGFQACVQPLTTGSFVNTASPSNECGYVSHTTVPVMPQQSPISNPNQKDPNHLSNHSQKQVPPERNDSGPLLENTAHAPYTVEDPHSNENHNDFNPISTTSSQNVPQPASTMAYVNPSLTVNMSAANVSSTVNNETSLKSVVEPMCKSDDTPLVQRQSRSRTRVARVARTASRLAKRSNSSKPYARNTVNSNNLENDNMTLSRDNNSSYSQSFSDQGIDQDQGQQNSRGDSIDGSNNNDKH